MAIDLSQVRDLKQTYEDEYQNRHDAFRQLRRYWQGDYWRLGAESSNQRSITSIFRDLGKSNQSTFPDIKLVHNIIQEVCVKYQTFLSPVPMIRMYVDPPETETRRNQATLKERYLYGIWAENRMSLQFKRTSWYLPLMGDCFIGCYPDFDKSIPAMIVRSPENSYPIPGADGDDAAHIFHSKLKDSLLRRTYPGYVSQPQVTGRFANIPGRKPRPADPVVDVYEYSDENEYALWAGNQKLKGVQHNFGFNIFQHLKFIEVPGETWGHGAVEQAINLNEMHNALYGLLFQAVLENVFPTMVLIDPSKAPEEIMRGPGAVIPVNAGGDVRFEAPPVAALPTQMGFLQANKAAIQEATSMPAVNFGQSPATAIVTGAAINELQGAGTGSTVEMVQSGMGMGMAAWNQMAMQIQQTLFRDDTISLYAQVPGSAMDARPKQISTRMKGSQLVGGGRNEVVFSPAMDQHDKLVMWLQAKGGGLVSDQFIREQIGIPDSEAMNEEIVGEEIQKAVLTFILQQLTDPSQASETERQAMGYIEGTGVVRAGPPSSQPVLRAGPPGSPPPGPAGGPPGAPGGPPGGLGGGGLVSAPPLQLPPGSPVPNGAPSGAAPGTGAAPAVAPVTLQTALRQLGQAQLQGQAWLVGAIVQTGKATGAVDVAITEPGDRDALQAAAQFPITFHQVTGEPKEQHVEIGTGQAGGAQPSLADLTAAA